MLIRKRGLMFLRWLRRFGLREAFAALLVLVSGAFAGAQQPALKLLPPIRPDTLLMQWQSSFIPAQDLDPVKSSMPPTSATSFYPPLSPADAPTPAASNGTTAIIRTFAGGSADGAALLASSFSQPY